MALSSEHEIKVTYASADVARGYVAERFASELHRLLHDRQVAAINKLARSRRPARTLEIAPGPGRLTRDVVRHGEWVCLEFNEAMLDEGRRVCDAGVQWRQGDAFALPFCNEFDFVYSFRFLRHFRRPDRDRLYEEVHRSLVPDGHLMFDAVNERVSGPMRAAHPEDYPIYDKLYADEGELRAELGDRGFEIVTLEPVQRCYRLQSRAQVLLGPRSRSLCRLAIRALERFWPGPALEWIVTCRRG